MESDADPNRFGVGRVQFILSALVTAAISIGLVVAIASGPPTMLAVIFGLGVVLGVAVTAAFIYAATRVR